MASRGLADNYKKYVRAGVFKVAEYLQSEQFELLIDDFAEKIGASFKYAEGETFHKLLNSPSRRIRIFTKATVVSEKCAALVAISAAAGGALVAGYTKNPAFITAAIAVCGSAKTAHLFLIALDVVRVGKRIPAKIILLPKR